MEDDDEEIYVRHNVHEEDWVANLLRMEIEDPHRWIDLISECYRYFWALQPQS